MDRSVGGNPAGSDLYPHAFLSNAPLLLFSPTHAPARGVAVAGAEAVTACRNESV